MKKKLITSEEFDITKLVLQLILILTGAFIFFGVVGYTLSHLQEPRVYRVTLLGFLGAIALFAVFAFGTYRVKERHRLATIIRKLSGESML